MKTTADRIPSREECFGLMERYGMLPNITRHSVQVMRVSLAIVDHLGNGAAVNRDLVAAAALLHDITKTRSLETGERHDASGGVLLRELGFGRIGRIVEEHVYLSNPDLQGGLEEREIVYYADKRVMHDRIVTLDDRLRDLVKRYGLTQEIASRILGNKSTILAVERKIAGCMGIGLEEAIREITTTD